MNKSVSINVTRVTAFCHASHTLLCICLFYVKARFMCIWQMTQVTEAKMQKKEDNKPTKGISDCHYIEY